MFCHKESAILSYRLEVFMVRSLALCHPTTLVLIQRGQFGPAPKPKVHADQTKRKRELGSMGLATLSDSIVHMESVQLIIGPPERLVMSGSNVTNACIGKPA